MPAPQLATTTFTAGPDQKLAVIDVYEEDGSGIVNSFQELHNNAIDVLDTLTGNKGGGGGGEGGGGNGGGGGDTDDGPAFEDFEDFDPIPSLDDFAPNNDFSDILDEDISALPFEDGFDSSFSLDKLSGLDNEILSNLNNLDKNIKNGIKMLGGVNDVFAQLGDVTNRLVDGVNLTSINAINNIVGNLSGGVKSVISDIGGKASLIASAAITGSRIGLPNVFGTIVNGAVAQAGQIAKSTINKAVTMMVPEIVKNANIPLLNDIARSPFGSVVSTVAPGIISNTIQNMAKPRNMMDNEYSRYYGNARDTFDLIEPGWNTTSFGNSDNLLNASVISDNDFFTDAMMANVTTRPLQITPTEGNSRYIDQSNTYYNNPETFDRDWDTGGFSYDDQGQIVNTTEQELFNRRTANRMTDSLITAALDFGKTTVESNLKKSFSKINAEINRSIRLF